MEAITITLNGREVSGHPGMTVLELARESGIDVPTLCYDPNLIPIGACRLCLVEDERTGNLLASCVTPIAPGMVINTESPKVQERRKTIIKLILSTHPDSCLVCDKGNRCELRHIASDLGVGETGLSRILPPATIEEVNPFIERDLSKCILCAKCIRADHELVVEGAIDYANRGFASRPATLHDLALENSECTFCGTCISICPTGALMERQREHRITATTTVSTICPLCGCGCGVDLEIKNNKIVRAVPGTESPVNHGTLCVKGSYGLDFIHNPERLTAPLIKTNGDFEPASWEQALDLISSEFNRIKGAHGSDSLSVLISSEGTNEESYLLQKLARLAIGTNNVDNSSRLYSAASIAGLGSAVGFPGSTCMMDSIDKSEVILVIGANLTSSAPAVGYAVKRAVKYKGAKLILIDPQQIKLSAFAHQWLKPKIGTDVALINGLANIIITGGLLDEEFVTRKTDNFEALSKEISRYTPDYVEQIAGIAGEELLSAARLFAKANLVSIIYGEGITQYHTGTDSVTALANLAMLTGSIGPCSGIIALQRHCNGQGACDMGALPDTLPGYGSTEDAQARKRFEDKWEVELPASLGLSAMEMLSAAQEKRIRGMYIAGEDAVVSFPNPDMVRKSLMSLDFLVVHDMFLTETAKLANVVLPALSFAEKEGTFTNFEGRVQRLHTAIEPSNDILPDWKVIATLANALGSTMPYSSIQQVMGEIGELVPLYDIAERKEPVTRRAYHTSLYKDPSKTRRLYKGHFPSGFGRFSPVQYQPRVESHGNGYTMTLLTGSILYHSGSGSKSSMSQRLHQFSPKAYVEISKGDADRIGIDENDPVKIVSSTGEVTVAARVSDSQAEGVLFMPVCFPATPVTQLFDSTMDPHVKTPAMKACAVKLERIESNE
jgi:formate dehydrogenase alpha subunit